MGTDVRSNGEEDAAPSCFCALTAHGPNGEQEGQKGECITPRPDLTGASTRPSFLERHHDSRVRRVGRITGIPQPGLVQSGRVKPLWNGVSSPSRPAKGWDRRAEGRASPPRATGGRALRTRCPPPRRRGRVQPSRAHVFVTGSALSAVRHPDPRRPRHHRAAAAEGEASQAPVLAGCPLMNVPWRSSSSACPISSRVFITKGP